MLRQVARIVMLLLLAGAMLAPAQLASAAPQLQSCYVGTSALNPNGYQVISFPAGYPRGSNPWVLLGDYYNYTFQLTSTPNSTLRVSYDNDETLVDLNSNTVLTAGQHTTYIYIWDSLPGNPAFSLSMCPNPGPSSSPTPSPSPASSPTSTSTPSPTSTSTPSPTSTSTSTPAGCADFWSNAAPENLTPRQIITFPPGYNWWQESQPYVLAGDFDGATFQLLTPPTDSLVRVSSENSYYFLELPDNEIHTFSGTTLFINISDSMEHSQPYQIRMCPDPYPGGGPGPTQLPTVTPTPTNTPIVYPTLGPSPTPAPGCETVSSTQINGYFGLNRNGNSRTIQYTLLAGSGVHSFITSAENQYTDEIISIGQTINVSFNTSYIEVYSFDGPFYLSFCPPLSTFVDPADSTAIPTIATIAPFQSAPLLPAMNSIAGEVQSTSGSPTGLIIMGLSLLVGVFRLLWTVIYRARSS